MLKKFFSLLLILFLSLSLLKPIHATVIPPIYVKPPSIANLTLSDGPIITITDVDIAVSGVTTLAQSLQTLGGVGLQDVVGNNSQVLLSLRGFGANANSNTLLLLNGVPLSNPDMAAPDLNSVLIPEIKRIEIVPGSEGVLYGDQAVGGIINVITKDSREHQLQIYCGGGSFDAHQCYLSLAKKIKQTYVDLAISDYKTNNFREHNAYHQKRLAGQINYLNAVNRIDFDMHVEDEQMKYPGALTRAQVKENPSLSTNHTDFFNNHNGFFHLNHQYFWNNHWQAETDVALRPMRGDGFLSIPFDQSRDVLFLKPRLKGVWDRANFLIGLELQKDRYHLGSDFGLTDDRESQSSVFALLNYKLSNRLSLSVGERGAWQRSELNALTEDTTNQALANTVGLSYQLRPETEAYLRRAESFRFPKADENAFTTEEKGLKTQTGASYETGIAINRPTFYGRLGVYQLNLQDEIAFDPTKTIEAPFGTNRNLDKTSRRGLILQAKQRLNQFFSIDSQYNYVNARFQNGLNAGSRIPLVAENTGRAGILYQMTEHWCLYGESLYTGNQFPANDDENIGPLMGGHFIYNLNLRYHYQTFSLSLRVNNLFNKRYYVYTVFEPSSRQTFYYPAPLRNFMLMLNYYLL